MDSAESCDGERVRHVMGTEGQTTQVVWSADGGGDGEAVSLQSDMILTFCFFFSSRRRHTRCSRDWSSDVCSSDLQTLLDVLLDTPVQSDRSRFSIEPRFARLGLRVTTVLRLVLPGGETRAFEFDGDPGLVRLDPRWHQAALRFVDLGFLHILDGTDHLLFLFCLVIPSRMCRK